MINILFICMGNICRSPSAEGFFARALSDSPYADRVSVDSAGTHGYHVGQPPDSRAVETAQGFGVDISGLRARKVSVEDFERFDLIVAMDHDNLADLKARQPANSKARLVSMMDYHPDPHPDEVPDPYYGGMTGFNYMCELLDAATRGLLEEVEGSLDG
ncbi:MAG: low molecular weight phosphotyrosine protein phosphatase [Xanthomonadales bacterium]|nr:low molecular weight phosphotyrosine protein phosphatase [Xanthomonadales bacterium]